MLTTLLLLTAPAAAADAAVAPFLAWGVSADEASALSGQLAQELDFMDLYDGVDALDAAPPGLNAACLTSADCMAAAAAAAGSEHLIAGQVSGGSAVDTPDTYDVFAVLFDAGAGAIVRQHRFQIAAGAVADELGGEVRFLVTGERAAVGAAATTSADDFLEDDDFSFEDPVAPADPIVVPTTAMDLGELVDEEPGYGEIPSVERYDPAVDEPAVAQGDEPPVRRVAAERDASFDKPRIDSRLSVTARVGYARYQSLNFVSWGGELGIEALQPVRINVGLEARSAPLPIEGSENDFGVPQVEWRSVLPFSVGAVYVFYTESLTPYVGGDLTLTAYTSSFDTAPGLRLRAGFDYMASEHFGVNADLSAGAWFGTRTEGKDIAVDLNSTGLAPAFSVGSVLAF